MATSKKGTLLQALMCSNGLGHSGNKRSIMGGVVKVNGVVVTSPDEPVGAGDTISVGKREQFQIVGSLEMELDKLSKSV